MKSDSAHIRSGSGEKRNIIKPALEQRNLVLDEFHNILIPPNVEQLEREAVMDVFLAHIQQETASLVYLYRDIRVLPNVVHVAAIHLYTMLRLRGSQLHELFTGNRLEVDDPNICWSDLDKAVYVTGNREIIRSKRSVRRILRRSSRLRRICSWR